MRGLVEKKSSFKWDGYEEVSGCYHSLLSFEANNEEK
jgi:hypothetical protein